MPSAARLGIEKSESPPAARHDVEILKGPITVGRLLVNPLRLKGRRVRPINLDPVKSAALAEVEKKD
jgi:hypothetical protein